MHKMLALPIDTTTKLGVQNNIVRMRGFESARTFLAGGSGLDLLDYPFIVIFIVVMGLLGGWLVFVPIIALIAYAALAVLTSDYMASKSNAAGVASARLEENAISAFHGMNAFHQAGADSQWLCYITMLARQSRNAQPGICDRFRPSPGAGRDIGLADCAGDIVPGHSPCAQRRNERQRADCDRDTDLANHNACPADIGFFDPIAPAAQFC